jgi:hypothetical protein
MAEVLLMIGAVLTALRGIAHLFPTTSVVAGFGEISTDNRLIITMEWIVDGVSLIFVGILVGAVTLIDRTAPIAGLVYFLSAGMLVVLAVVSLFTGFKVSFLPFKLCPAIFGLSAVLFIVGAVCLIWSSLMAV